MVDLDRAKRLQSAMDELKITNSDLARACDVSPAAVGKWLAGGAMKADSLARAARALGLRDEYLRTGKLPREREGAEPERRADEVVARLKGLRDPLAALLAAVDALAQAESAPIKKRGKP